MQMDKQDSRIFQSYVQYRNINENDITGNGFNGRWSSQ